jgi:hypothetical protein
MALEIYDTQIPSLITWFNQFIGFREVQNRIERVEAKLKESDYASPALNRRYSFHTTYREIVLRNRRCQKIDIRNLENYRVLSTLASLKEITRALPAQHIAELKARVLDSLSPDQDVRRFEHELRVFVHYRQAGLSVTPIPTNGLNRFDFLVSTPKGEFEVECKTFSEDIGKAISIEQSLTFFRAIKFVIGSWNDSIESGIFTITLPAKSLPTRNEISSFMKSFLAKSPQTSDYGAFRISFQRKPEWDHYLPTKDFEGVAEEMAAEHQRTRPRGQI